MARPDTGEDDSKPLAQPNPKKAVPRVVLPGSADDAAGHAVDLASSCKPGMHFDADQPRNDFKKESKQSQASYSMFVLL